MITFIVGIEQGLEVDRVKDCVRRNIEAFRTLLDRSRASDIVVKTVLHEVYIGRPVSGEYMFQLDPFTGTYANADLLELLRRFPDQGAGTVRVLVSDAAFRARKADGTFEEPDGVSPPYAGGFAVRVGDIPVPGGRGCKPGIFNNENLFAHEAGHVAGYRGDDRGHSTKKDNVMYGGGVSCGNIKADDVYIARIREFAHTPDPLIG